MTKSSLSKNSNSFRLDFYTRPCSSLYSSLWNFQLWNHGEPLSSIQPLTLTKNNKNRLILLWDWWGRLLNLQSIFEVYVLQTCRAQKGEVGCIQFLGMRSSSIHSMQCRWYANTGRSNCKCLQHLQLSVTLFSVSHDEVDVSLIRNSKLRFSALYVLYMFNWHLRIPFS